MELENITRKELKNKDPEVALLPIGSTEQHGPHAPYKTDSLIATEITTKASEKTNTLMLPTIKISVSREHSSFKGTLYVSPNTFISYLTDTLKSASEQGINKFIIVNGHGGNRGIIRTVCMNLYHDNNIFAIKWNWWDAIDADLGHAGELETSLLKYLNPELISKPLKKGKNTWGKSVHGSTVDYDTSKFSKNGVIGDPANATKEKGKKTFKKSVKELTELIKEFKNNSFGF